MDDPTFTPSVWDRLMAAGEPTARERGAGRLSAKHFKAAVAHDLENLLNTRVALPPDMLNGFPACRKSILNFGLVDFAALCLSSSDDRRLICAHLVEAIRRFEPRLSDVSAEVGFGGTVNQLDFIISATLKADTSERLELNATLQPSTLRYVVAPSRRGQHIAKGAPR